MRDVRVTDEDARKAGILVPISSRSYTLWINKLAPFLHRRGITKEAIQSGRGACHVQPCEGGVVLRFKDPDEGIKRNAALRAAQGKMIEEQSKALASEKRKQKRNDD